MLQFHSKYVFFCHRYTRTTSRSCLSGGASARKGSNSKGRDVGIWAIDSCTDTAAPLVDAILLLLSMRIIYRQYYPNDSTTTPSQFGDSGNINVIFRPHTEYSLAIQKLTLLAEWEQNRSNNLDLISKDAGTVLPQGTFCLLSFPSVLSSSAIATRTQQASCGHGF